MELPKGWTYNKETNSIEYTISVKYIFKELINKIMNSKKDKIATISAICCIASVGFILGITIVTMILQAVAGGAVLYPIISLILGSVCYYIVTQDKVREQIENEKKMEEVIKKEREKMLYN